MEEIITCTITPILVTTAEASTVLIMPKHQVSASKSYRCSRCSKKLPGRSSLKSHEEKCFQERRYRCTDKQCKYSSSRRANLERHLQSCTRSEQQHKETDSHSTQVARETVVSNQLSAAANEGSAVTQTEVQPCTEPVSTAQNIGPSLTCESVTPSTSASGWSCDIDVSTLDDLLATFDSETTGLIPSGPATPDSSPQASFQPTCPPVPNQTTEQTSALCEVGRPWKLIPLDPPEIPLPDPRLLNWPSPSSDCCCRASRQLFHIRARAKAAPGTRSGRVRNTQSLPAGVNYGEVEEEAHLPDGTYYKITYRGYQLPSLPGVF